MALFTATAALTAVADLLAKALVFRLIPDEGQSLGVIPGFFHLSHVLNRGGVFGVLQGRVWFFVVFSLAAIGFVLWLFATQGGESRWLTVALGLVLGGAVGNLYDRVFLGHVRDFLDFHFGQWRYPAFNVADSAICVGVAVLAILSLFCAPEKRKRRAEEETSPAEDSD